MTARVFQLVREQDITGVSGTGVVADGALWPDGSVSIRWRGDRPSIVFWHDLAAAEAVHGHGGATRFVWADDVADEPSMPPPDEAERALHTKAHVASGDGHAFVCMRCWEPWPCATRRAKADR